VELVGAYSNQALQSQNLRDLVLLQPDDPERLPRITRQAQNHLPEESIENLMADYLAGIPIDDLTRIYGLSRSAVMGLRSRRAVPSRNPKLSPTDMRRAVKMYESGKSLAVVGVYLGVAPNTIKRALQKSGVRLRLRPGRRMER
jgi:hypothetical protein